MTRHGCVFVFVDGRKKTLDAGTKPMRIRVCDHDNGNREHTFDRVKFVGPCGPEGTPKTWYEYHEQEPR